MSYLFIVITFYLNTVEKVTPLLFFYLFYILILSTYIHEEVKANCPLFFYNFDHI